MSQDGFIADKNGSVAWLEKYGDGSGQNDCGYKNFYSSIDALVFGKNTYNQLLTFGPWVYPDKKSYVFAGKDTLAINDMIEIVDTDIPTFMKKINKSGIKRLWLMGGAQLIESFYKRGLIDEYIITILPDKLEQGIALPEPIVQAKGLKLIDTITYPYFGIIQKQYVPEANK